MKLAEFGIIDRLRVDTAFSHGDVVDVKHYGTNLAALQAAVAACPANGTVLFSPGAYAITGETTISKSLRIRAEPGAIITFTGADAIFEYEAAAGKRIWIEGLEVTGSGTGDIFKFKPADATEAAAETLQSLRIFNCRTTQQNICTVNGTIVDESFVAFNLCGDGTITRHIIIGSAPFTPSTIKSAVIAFNRVKGLNGGGSNTAGISLDDATDEAIVIGNHVSGCTVNCYDMDAGARRAIFSGNRAEDSDVGYTIKNGTRYDSAVTEDVVFTGNYCYNTSGEALEWRSRGIVVGNAFVDCGAAGSRTIYLSDTKSAGSHFIGNLIRSSSSASKCARVQITSATDLLFEGNLFDGLADRAFRIEGGVSTVIRGLRIFNNTFRFETGLAAKGWVFHFLSTGYSDLVRIVGNRVAGDSGQAHGFLQVASTNHTNVMSYDNNGTNIAAADWNDTSAAGTANVIRRTAITSASAGPDVIGVTDNPVLTSTLNGNLTNFVRGTDGQVITVLFSTANTTIVDGTNIMLSGSVNYNPPAGTLMQFVRRDGVWYELSRSNT